MRGVYKQGNAGGGDLVNPRAEFDTIPGRELRPQNGGPYIRA